MRPFSVRPVFCLKGKVRLSGDKSIAHRALIASAISKGKTLIVNYPANNDCLMTLRAFRKLGVKIISKKDSSLKGALRVAVYGKGLKGLTVPRGPISAGESGTTLRLLSGVLAGQEFESRIEAGPSLKLRPMLRITRPLRFMGARIETRIRKVRGGKEEYAPLEIRGGNLRPIRYRLAVASAQVKSAIMFAGLYACGTTEIIEPVKTRDHTERILKLFGADVAVSKNNIRVKGGKELVSPKIFYVPSDLSSASFFIVAALIIPGSLFTIEGVSLNPSRMGFVRVLKRMGARLRVCVSQGAASGYEPSGSITAKSSALESTVVKPDEVPSLIDEIPILMVAACFARGRTVFKSVQELRVKETDRINSMVYNLRKIGARIEVRKRGRSEDVIVHGGRGLKGSQLRSYGDHRTAMSLIIAGLCSADGLRLDDIGCISKSFPAFTRILKGLSRFRKG